jgi:hypothetical protein
VQTLKDLSSREECQLQKDLIARDAREIDHSLDDRQGASDAMLSNVESSSRDFGVPMREKRAIHFRSNC